MINYHNLKQIIQILNDGQFHSGSELGEVLGLTRGGIWKIVQQLQELGVEIEAKTKQGYRLLQPIEFFDLEKIRSYLPGSHHNYINKAVVFSEIDSTHTRLVQQVHNSDRNNLIYFAERQTAGRGRSGRPWHSPFARNIMLSLLWQTALDFSELSGLSLVVALALGKALKNYGVTGIELKWPNDILWQRQKIAGILIELHSELNNESQVQCDVIISFGINLYLPQALKESLEYPVTDMASILGKTPERNKLTGYILGELLETLHKFSQQGLPPFIEQWQELDCAFNSPVLILLGENTIPGINRGITERGYLRLETSSKEIRNFSSGEVSLRLTNPDSQQ